MFRPMFCSISLLTLLALAPNCACATTPAPSSPSRSVAGGAADTGGGHAELGPLMTAEEIRNIIQGIQKPAAAFFKYVSIISYHNDSGYFGGYAPEYRGLANKLFSGAREDSILQKIYNVQPTILMQGSCRDSAGNPTEASGLRNPDRLCFSVERLVQRHDLHRSNGYAILMGLAAHEYSHLVGSTEAEALMLQNSLALLVISNQSYDLVQSDFARLETDVAATTHSLQSLSEMIASHGAIETVCMNVGFDYGRLLGNFDRLFEARAGVAYLSRYEMNLLLRGLYTGFNYMMFCQNDANATLMRNRMFGQRTQIPVWDFLMNLGYDPQGTIRVPGMVTRIEYGAYDTLGTEIAELVRELHTVNDAWPSNMHSAAAHH